MIAECFEIEIKLRNVGLGNKKYNIERYFICVKFYYNYQLRSKHLTLLPPIIWVYATQRK